MRVVLVLIFIIIWIPSKSQSRIIIENNGCWTESTEALEIISDSLGYVYVFYTLYNSNMSIIRQERHVLDKKNWDSFKKQISRKKNKYKFEIKKANVIGGETFTFSGEIEFVLYDYKNRLRVKVLKELGILLVNYSSSLN